MRRKSLLFIWLLLASACSLNCQTNAVGKPASSDDKTKPCKFLSFAEAAKILGQPVQLVTNSWTPASEGTRFDCTYAVVSKVTSGEREINLFFMLEEASSESRAKEIYEVIRKSNESHEGIEKLTEIGDEGFSQNDKPNFYLIMARKGKFTIRLKINRAAETTSFDELKAFAKKVAGQI